MSTRPGPRAARLAADQARQQMRDTLATLKSRVEPARLRADAVNAVQIRATDAALSGLKLARRRPALIVGAVVATLALLARKPLLRLVRRHRERSAAPIVETTATLSAPNSVKGTQP